MEQWKEIPGYEHYQVSNFGAVRNSMGNMLALRLNGTRENNKYLVADLQRKEEGVHWTKRKKIMKIHRAVLMAFVGMPQKGQIGCHKDGVKTNNKLDNLYWGTRESNAADSIKHGTFSFPHPGFGEKHHMAKYSDELIARIRSEHTGKRGESTTLSRKYAIPLTSIDAIVKRRIRAGGVR